MVTTAARFRPFKSLLIIADPQLLNLDPLLFRRGGGRGKRGLLGFGNVG